MKTLFCIFLIIAGAALMDSPSTAGTKKNADAEQIQGNWHIVSMPPGWKRVPGVRVVVSPENAKVYVGALRTTQINYKLNPAQNTIDASRRENGKDIVQLGTYSLSGDTLKISVGAEGKPRPSTPDAVDSGAMPWVFRRAK